MTDTILRGALMASYVGLVFTSRTKLQRVIAVIAIAISAVIEVATR